MAESGSLSLCLKSCDRLEVDQCAVHLTLLLCWTVVVFIGACAADADPVVTLLLLSHCTCVLSIKSSCVNHMSCTK